MVTGKKLPLINCKKRIKEALTVINKKNLELVVVIKNKLYCRTYY